MTQSGDAPHYRWAEMIEDCPIPLIRRRLIRGEHAMVAQVRLEKGFKVPTHWHENEQFACVLSGSMLFVIGEEERIVVGPGEVLVLPSNVPHSAEALEDSVLFDIFSPVAEKMGVDMATG